jgi:hypothetical protein
MAQADDKSDISKEEKQTKVGYSEHYINTPKYSDEELVEFQKAWLKKHEHIIIQEPFSGQASLQPWLQAKLKDKNFWSNVFGVGPLLQTMRQANAGVGDEPLDPRMAADPPGTDRGTTSSSSTSGAPSTTTTTRGDDATVPTMGPATTGPPATTTAPATTKSTESTTTTGAESSDSHISTFATKIVPSWYDYLSPAFVHFDSTKSKKESEGTEKTRRIETEDLEKKGAFYVVPETKDSTARTLVATATTSTNDGRDKGTILSTDDLMALDTTTGMFPGATEGSDNPTVAVGAESLERADADKLHFAKDADRFGIASSEADTSYTTTIKDRIIATTKNTFEFLKFVTNKLADSVVTTSEENLKELEKIIFLEKLNDFKESDKLWGEFNYKYNYEFADPLEAHSFFTKLKDQKMQEKASLFKEMPRELRAEYEKALTTSLSDKEFDSVLKLHKGTITLGEYRYLKDWTEDVPTDKNTKIDVYSPESELVTGTKEAARADATEATDLTKTFTNEMVKKQIGSITTASQQVASLGTTISENMMVTLLGSVYGDLMRLDRKIFENAGELNEADIQKIMISMTNVMPVVDKFLKENPTSMYVRALKNLLVESANAIKGIEITSTSTEPESAYLSETQNIIEDIFALSAKADEDMEEREDMDEKELPDRLEYLNVDVSRVQGDLNNFLYKGTSTAEDKRVEYKKLVLKTKKLTDDIKASPVVNYRLIGQLTSGILPALYQAAQMIRNMGKSSDMSTKMGFGVFAKPKTLEYAPIQEAHVLDHYMEKNLPKPVFMNAHMVKKQAKGCEGCGGNSMLKGHMKDDDDLMCRICLQGKGMTAKRYSPYTTRFIDLAKSKSKRHQEILRQHNINAHLDRLTADKAKPTLWEEFDAGAKINKNFVAPYSTSYMMNRKPNSKRDLDKLTYFLGKLEHDPENMSPYAKANLQTLANNHLMSTRAYPEHRLKGSGLRININAFDTFDALKDHLNTNPYFLNFLLV